MENLLLRKPVIKKFCFKIHETGLHKRSPALRFLESISFSKIDFCYSYQ